jgi:hypothetical protein
MTDEQIQRLCRAIDTLAGRAAATEDANEAMKFAQAAQNLGHIWFMRADLAFREMERDSK